MGYVGISYLQSGYIWQVETDDILVEHREGREDYIVWIWNKDNTLYTHDPEEVLTKIGEEYE